MGLKYKVTEVLYVTQPTPSILSTFFRSLEIGKVFDIDNLTASVTRSGMEVGTMEQSLIKVFVGFQSKAVNRPDGYIRVQIQNS